MRVEEGVVISLQATACRTGRWLQCHCPTVPRPTRHLLLSATPCCCSPTSLASTGLLATPALLPIQELGDVDVVGMWEQW